MTRNIKMILAAGAAAALLLALSFSVIRRGQEAGEGALAWDDLLRTSEKKGLPAALGIVDGRLAGHPRDSLLYYYKARLNYEAGRGQEALAEADRAISFGYAQESSHLLKALVYGRIYTDYHRQKELASKALSYDPTYDEGYLVRAEAEYMLAEYPACIKDAAASSSLNPKVVDGYQNGILCMEAAGDFAGSEKACLKILALKPGTHAAVWHLGRAYAGQGRHKEAIAKFTEAIRLSGGRPRYFVDRALSCEAVGDFSCTAWDYDMAAAWDEFGEKASHQHKLAEALYRIGDLEEALTAANAAVKKEPAAAVHYGLRARVLAEAGKLSAAEKDLRKMVELDPALKAEADDLLARIKRGR